MPSLDTIPAETRAQIFSYLRPRTFPIRLGHDVYNHAQTGSLVPTQSTVNTYPAMNGCTTMMRVCRLFDQEFTFELYRRFTFSVENTTAAMEAGARFVKNLRPSTIQNISKFLIFHHPKESDEPGFSQARDNFCQAAGALSLSTVRIYVGQGLRYDFHLTQWLPLLEIEQVAQFVVRFGSVPYHLKSDLHICLDELNARGIKATAPGYIYRPAVLALESA